MRREGSVRYARQGEIQDGAIRWGGVDCVAVETKT